MRATLRSIALLVAAFSPAGAQEPTVVDAPGGRAVVHAEIPAAVGTAVQCEMTVAEVHDDGDWASTFALTLDEGKAEDRDSRFVQVDMSMLPDRVMHTVTKGGFGTEYQEPFLIHQRQPITHFMTLAWERDGVFRYDSTLGESVTAAGRIDQPGFAPKFLRVTVIGMRVELECGEVELED